MLLLRQINPNEMVLDEALYHIRVLIYLAEEQEKRQK
jgi:hypothetical protein